MMSNGRREETLIVRMLFVASALFAGLAGPVCAEENSLGAVENWKGCWTIQKGGLERLSSDIRADTELAEFSCHPRTQMEFCFDDITLKRKRGDVHIYELWPKAAEGKRKAWRLRSIPSNETDPSPDQPSRTFVGELMVSKQDIPVAPRVTYEFRCSIRMEMTVDKEGHVIETIDPILQAAWGSPSRGRWVGLRHIAFERVD